MKDRLLATNPTPIHLLGQPVSAILRNVGAVEIPPHSLVEVTGSYLTAVADPSPIVGQLVLQVRRPTKNIHFSLASSGPIAIPQNKQGPGFYGPVLPIGQATAPGINNQCRPTADGFGLTPGTGPLLQLTSGGSVNLYALNSVQQMYGFILTDTMGFESGAANITDPKDGTFLLTDETVYDPFNYYFGSLTGTEGFVVYCHDRWLCLPGEGSGKDCGKIQFTIVSANLTAGTALVTITHRPCGCELVPQESGGTVTVHDEMGFFADEIAEDLVGRKGTAWYGQDDANAGSSSDGCKWLIDGLQCETDDEAIPV